MGKEEVESKEKIIKTDEELRSRLESIWSGSSIKLLFIGSNKDDLNSLRDLVSKTEKYPVVLENTDNLKTGLELLSKYKSDVVLVDLNLPDSKGVATFERIHEKSPQTAMITLINPNEEEFALSLIQKGAQDYIIRGQINDKSLLHALRCSILHNKVQYELKVKVQSLVESQSRFFSIVGNTSTGIVIVNTKGIVRYANQAACRLLNKEENQLLGKQFGYPITAGETQMFSTHESTGHTLVGVMEVTETEWEKETAYLVS